MKPISPTLHGVLDYATAGLFFALPRLLGWRGPAASVLTAAAVGATAYSLLTDYRLGAVRVLPMPAHLALDGVLDAVLLGAPFVLADAEPAAKPTLVALGLTGLTITLLTEPNAPAATT